MGDNTATIQYSRDFSPGQASHRSEQWAFQNGVFPDKHWLPRASYYIHHFENGPVRNLVLRAFSKKRHAYALFCI